MKTNMVLRCLLICIWCMYGAPEALPCTSAVVAARASASGRPLLWKHRDTGVEQNFVERVPAGVGSHGYVALYNAGDSLLSEAWIGLNDAGFAIMNTASYNLAPDTATVKDREGVIMTEALRHCASLDDFESMIASMPRPLGVQANFGVIDAEGGAAYYEMGDYTYRKYDVNETPDGVMVRTNFSFSGECGDGLGRVRYATAVARLAPYGYGRILLTPEVFTEQMSRRFDRAGDEPVNHECLNDEIEIEDVDFIPRRSTSASVVVEGAAHSGDTDGMVMWTMPGYPPCSAVEAVTVDYVPDGLRPLLSGWRSEQWDDMVRLKHKIISERDGRFYVDLLNVRMMDKSARSRSRVSYLLKRREIQK